MANPISFTITVGGKDYTDHTPFPIKWSSMLDERLDEAKISLKQCLTRLFAPLTPVKIVASSRLKTVEKNYVIATDSARELPIHSGRWNHEINLIEETKLLEGFIVDALTFTNDLGRDYTRGAIAVIPKVDVGEIAVNVNNPESYKTPLGRNSSLDIYPPPYILRYSPGGDPRLLFSLVVERFGSAEPVIKKLRLPAEVFKMEKILLDENDVYTVRYAVIEILPDGNERATSISYDFQVVPNELPLPRWNITTVINRVLDLAETHLKGVEPRFRLNAAQAEQFSKIEAPEFAFTRATLKEILDQIGGFIHGIPRLSNGEITYDMLGGTTVAKLSGREEFFIEKVISQNIENYCSKLDSNVDNLVNILDRNQGVITEPYGSGYKTVRTENIYARIEEGNMCITTSFPIQDISALKCGIVAEDGDTKTYGGDITPYIFEKADYSRLSSFDELYPTSKAYALYFTQGEKNIYGLNFKAKEVTGGAFSCYAIANILKETCGVDIGSWGVATDYPTLSFQITYTPIFNARVQASKQNISEFKYPRTLAFNQGANLVETRYYGENMKGVIARMGNPEQIRTVILEGFNLVPEIGEIFDEEYYVSSVDVEVMPTEVKCTMGLSKDFNRLSEYIGINSRKRYYEVSEKQAYLRDISYIDYCVIGDDEAWDKDTWLGVYTTEYLKEIFLQRPNFASRLVTFAQIKSLSGEDPNEATPLANVILPVISTAFGNSMVFTFSYEDNYSAGLKSVKSTNGIVSGYFAQSVPYGDYYGRVDYLSIELLHYGVGFTNKDRQTLLGNAVPEVVTNAPNSIFGTPWNRPLVVKKNGTEILAVNYQLEFVTNKSNYIIGSAITRKSSLIRGTMTEPGHGAKLYVLPNRIGKFADIIDLSGATVVTDYSVNPEKITATSVKPQLVFSSETTPTNGNAWAIVDGKSGELLIGCNLVITSGDTLTMPIMTFKHDVYKRENVKRW